MLNKKRYQKSPKRNKKENKNNKNPKERVILDLPPKPKKEQNSKAKKNKEKTNKRNVKGKRNKDINNDSIHNKEDQNDNSENINDNQSFESQIDKDIHTSFTRSQNMEGSNIFVNNKHNTLTYNTYIIPNQNDIEEPIKRSKSDNNIFKNRSILPNNCDIFKKLELFNSILLIINNISLIKNYFSKDKVIDLIEKCEKNDKYSLSSISYYINKCLWQINDKKTISQKNLLKKYKESINFYSKKYWENRNPNLYCYETNNIENIIKFIYDEINVELTNSKDNKKICESKNNDSLSKYKEEFSKKYHSIISDYFMGTNRYEINCRRCNNTQYTYEPFMTINFNIKKIFGFYSNNNNYIKLNNCFNYLSCNKEKKFYNSFCEKCSGITPKEEIASIYVLPDIITIILTDNNDNDYFMFEDEIYLKNYELNKREKKSYLVSILCQIAYNGKFISYCINPNNGLWYSYTDGNISQVDKMDLNSIPLMLVYQIKKEKEIDFTYKPIKRELNKIKFNISFSKGIIETIIYFSKNDSFKDLDEKISSYFNLKNKIYKIKINEMEIKEGQTINEFISHNNNNNIFVSFNKK